MVSESISEVAGMMENQLGWFVLKWAEVKDLPLATESSKIERFRESVTEKNITIPQLVIPLLINFLATNSSGQ